MYYAVWCDIPDDLYLRIALLLRSQDHYKRAHENVLGMSDAARTLLTVSGALRKAGQPLLEVHI